MASLSKAQLAVLQEAADPHNGRAGASAVAWYPPVKKLLALGYIKPYEGTNSFNNQWVITEAGKAALAKIKP